MSKGKWIRRDDDDGLHVFERVRHDPERVEVSWVEAEELYPGCSAEWDQICIQGAGPWCPTPRSDDGYHIYIRTYRDTGQKSVEVVLDDPDRKWYWPPRWIRSEHSWNSPLPMPMSLMLKMNDWLRDDYDLVQNTPELKGDEHSYSPRVFHDPRVGNLGQSPPEAGDCPNCGAPHVGLGHLDRTHGTGLWTGCRPEE